MCKGVMNLEWSESATTPQKRHTLRATASDDLSRGTR